MPTQACPNCQRVHDIGVYVSGQRVQCNCGIRFEVRRSDVSTRTLNLRPSTRITERAGRTEAPVQAGVDISLSALGNLPEPAVLAPPVNGSVRNHVEPGVDRTFIASAHVDIPGFDLLELLGRGGMGEVWRAHQVSLGRTVAVKLLPQELAKDREFVTRFEKESAALAALSHPHIIQIIDRGEAGSNYYFVMEYVEGKSLRELIAERRLSAAEALKIVAQILKAIETAHEKQIIHRDLKPENILLDAKGHVKVADFGLAGMRGGEERLQLTATAVAMGTINYMAPEQRRDARNVDARADLYSTGVILYELLTGELPIGRFRMPSEKVPGLDPRLDEIVGKLLESDPSHRYATATEVLSALEPLLGSGVSTPLPASQVKTGMPATTERAPLTNRSVVERGFRGLRNGLMVIGGLAVVGFGSQFFFTDDTAPKLTFSSAGKEITISPNGVKANGGGPDAVKLPAASGNTAGEVFSAVEEKDLGGGRSALGITFEPGDEEINVHSGEWTMDGGKLRALQAGNVPPEGKALIPRAYVAHRYFSADDYEAEVELSYKDVRDRYEIGEDVQRFAELSLRITNTQISAFAIPGVGMRLGWRYFTPDGLEQAGNSARDLELMVEDEMPAPVDGKPFKLKLKLQRVKDAVDVTAYLNGRRFAHKVLPGLQGQVGKIAVGCRNYECLFENVAVQGKTAERPSRKVADGQ